MKNIIEEIIKKGYFIQDEKVLSSISDDDLKKLISLLPKSEVPEILTEEKIFEILRKEKKRRIEIKFVFEKIEKKKINILDFHSFLKERYNYLSMIIKNKLSFFDNLLSINKISKKYKTFSIIGMVFKILDKKITVEDFTSRIDILVIDREKVKYLEEDCVVGFKCRWEGNNIVCDDVVYPDFKNEERIENKEKLKGLGFGFVLEGSEELGEDVTFFLNSNENRIQDEKVYLDKKYPIHQVYVNNSLIVIVDEDKIKFDKEKFVRLRLIESNVKNILNYGFDIGLVKEIPSAIVLLSSKNVENRMEEEEYFYIVRISKNSKHHIIRFQ